MADILALLDSLPYDELDLETPRFRLTLRRTPAGWTQSTAGPLRSGADVDRHEPHRGGPTATMHVVAVAGRMGPVDGGEGRG